MNATTATGEIQTSPEAGLLRAQREVLELVAANAPLEATVQRLLRSLETELPGAFACLCAPPEEATGGVRISAARALPPGLEAVLRQAYRSVIQRFALAKEKLSPAVTDLGTDPRLAAHRMPVAAEGFPSCWLAPVVGAAPRPSALLVVTFRQVQEPAEPDFERMRTVAALLAIALDADARQRPPAARGERATAVRPEARGGTWDWNLHTGAVTCSGETCRLLGVEPVATGSGIREHLRRTVHPEDAARLEVFLARAMATLGTYGVECRLLRSDGSVRFVELDAAVLADATGAPARLLGGVRDTTGLRRAEEHLRALAETLDEAQRIAQIGSWSWEVDRDVAWWADEVYRICGVSPQGYVPSASSYLKIVHPNDRARLGKAVARAIERGVLDDEHRLVCPDGEVRWVHAVARLTADLGTRRLRMIGTLQDVTARRASEQAMRSLATRLEQAQQAAGIGTWEWDFVGEAGWWSAELYRMFGLDAASFRLTAASFLGCVHADDAERVKTETVRAMGGEALDIEYRVRRADGAVLWVHSQARLVHRSDAGPRLIGTTSDITARRAAEDAIRTLAGRLEEAQRAAGIGSWEWIAGTEIVWWSDEMYRLFGLDRDAFTPSLSGWFQLIHPEDRERVQAEAAIPSDATVVEIEYRIVRPDGQVRWVHSRSQPTRESAGSAQRMRGTLQDVTARRQADESLRTLAQRLEESQRIARLGSWELDLTTDTLWWSDEVYRIFGVAREAFGASSDAFHRFAHPEDLEAMLATEQQALQDGVLDMEHRIVRADGDVRWVHERAQVFFDACRQPVHMRGTVQDITARKETEGVLAERDALVRSLLESIDDLVFIKDTGGRYLALNAAARAVLGRTEDECLGKTDADLFPPALAAQLRLADEATMASGTASRAENVIRYPDGRERHIETLTTPYRGPRGECLGVCGVARDVTERKQVLADLRWNKEALERAVSTLDAALESTADGILVLDSQWRILRYNQRFAELWQVPAELLAEGDDRKAVAFARDQLADPQAFEAMVRLTYAAPERESVDVLHFRDGRVFERYVHPLRVNGAVEGRVCSFRDVTARVLADAERERFHETLEERVRQRTADLEASNMELESFSYSVSHDLRTPLRGIEGWSYLVLERNGDALGEQGRAGVERVRAEAKRMAAVLDNLLRLARVTRSEMRRVEVDLGQLARERIETLQGLDPERSVEVRVASDLMAVGDRALLETLLANLLENAWKFTMRTPRPVIELGLERVDGERIFFVRDNGAGFDMAHADRLFGAFERLHPAREYPGTGIGLATVARVVRRHGGRVWAEGAVGKGATVRFTLG